ncbi:MAG: family transcriptional regulator, cyclic receptor protein [Oceanotoga sp.]|uniref:Crp/Fnr family transcriptional regulator n=1 Tax=Oceanotoga sp. TaxID=2108366 RepID=UPI00265443ED|nr:Crp/Fnr family transcriptional regulator [Oceanotoga sp.]MDN5341418.1 family transcriptional regulator, cyclic receptor protein [Oceanotoga sp.]
MKEADMFNKMFSKKLQEKMTDKLLNYIAPLGKQKNYSKNQIVEICDSNHIYIVTNGYFKKLVYSPEGKEISFYRLNAGTIFGEMDFFDNQKTFGIVKSLEENSSISAVNRKIIEEMLITDKELYWCFMHSIIRKFRIISLNYVNSLSNDSTGKLAGFLIALIAQHGQKCTQESKIIPYPYTHQEIANALGISRITITKSINELKKLGLITYYGKYIKIENPKELMKLYKTVW